MAVIGGIGFVLALIFMIMFHEFGHYVAAKRFGMKVTEFFLGFGPRLWSRRPPGSETEYGVKAVPAGGYVKIVGMNPLEEIPPEEEPRTFRGKPAHQKLVVLVAGSATHFLTGFILLVVVFSGLGRLESAPVIGEVIHQAGEPLPAERFGFQDGDRVVSANGMPIGTWEQLSNFILAHPNQAVTLVVERGGQRLELRPTLSTNEEGKGFLGFKPGVVVVRDSLPMGVVHSGQAFWDIGFNGLKGLGQFFTPSHLGRYLSLLAGQENPQADKERVISVVGAVRLGSESEHLYEYVGLIATINVFVGIVNLLPLFPLDGGWVAVTLYEKVASTLRRRRVTVDFRRLVPLTYAVVFVFGFLFLTSLYLDIANPVRLNL